MLKMKEARARLISLACMITVVLFSGCSDDDKNEIPEPDNTNKEAIAAFRSYFYRGDTVYAFKQDNFLETEWAVPIEDADVPCTIFSRVTGLQVPLTDSYSYSYQPGDESFSIRIEGRKIPRDAIYCTMYVNIPDCPEIRSIIFSTPEYFDNENAYEWIVVERL